MPSDFSTRTWPPGARSPSSESPFNSDASDPSALVLDREFLRVTDGSVSRAENAPRLRALSLTTLEIEVPEASAHPVVAIEGIRFEALQQGIAPANEEWKVAPGELSRPGRVVVGEKASLALVRQMAWDREGGTHHLMLLPRCVRVRRGEKKTVVAPAVVVVGQAAVDVTPSETWVPAAMPFEVGEGVRSFRLREIERLLEASEGVGQMLVLPPMGWLRVSEFEEAFRIAELLGLAGALLPGGRQYAFVPVLEDERRALLGLVYRRADGSAGMMLGRQQPADFLAGLTTALLAVQPNAAQPKEESARKSQAPPSRTVVARLGDVETRSAAFGRAVSQLETVAAGDLGILFLGESGTGKEHLARAVHAASPRAKERFVGVNCGALPEGLIASELFGTRRGAFSGGIDRDGAFVSADGGTLFLDEIGDAPLPVQVALLRVLETRRVTPLGSNVETPVDVRVFAATSRDLEALMREGKFREDLYYRLTEFTVTVPALRERREDVPALATTILRSFADGVSLSSQAEALLMQNEWRGNVRELKNTLRRAVALARGTTLLQAIHLSPGHDDAPEGASAEPAAPDEPLAFPPHVVARADAMWAGAETAEETDDASKYEQRARERAALLCLSARTPVTTWPKALAAHWYRLFRATWATSEDGRGLRDLVRELGLDARDEGVREAVRRRVRE